MKKINTLKLKFRIVLALYNFALSSFLSIYVIYFNKKGFNFSQINSFDAFFLIIIFLFEIPTGTIADVYGRKISFLWSAITRSIAMLFYFAASNMTMVFIGSFLAAFSETCFSGAFSAWLVDSLKKENGSINLKNIFSTNRIIVSVINISGGFTGALLSTKINLGAPWIVSSVFFTISAIGALFIPEIKIKKNKLHIKEGMIELTHVVKKSIQVIIKTPILFFLALILFILELGLAGPNNLWQPLFHQFTDSKSLMILGYVWVMIQLTVIIANLIVKIKISLKDENLLLVTSVFIAISLFFLYKANNFLLALLSFFIFILFYNYNEPVIAHLIHNSIDSRIRATIGSWFSLITSFAGAIGLILSGFIADQVSISYVFFISSLFIIICTLFLCLINIIKSYMKSKY